MGEKLNQLNQLVRHDENCGHPKKFRKRYSNLSFCTLCALDRHIALQNDMLGRIAVYEGYYLRLEPSVAPDTKVIMWFPSAGSTSDREALRKCDLKLGQVCTVDHAEVDAWTTALFLKEFPNQPFNLCNFAYYEPKEQH